jgi:hypothetical protein
MHGARFRRVGGLVVGCIVIVSLTACHGGGAPSSISSAGNGNGAVDVKSACAALEGLGRASDALKGVNIADPDESTAALNHAIAAYSAALATFAQVGPVNLRATAATVRADVIAPHFGQAAAARTALSDWDDTHCAS